MEYTLPCKAFYDSFAGMLTCEVLEVLNDHKVKIIITSRKNKSYKRGEILEVVNYKVFPRKCFHKTGIFTYRVDEYTWAK